MQISRRFLLACVAVAVFLPSLVSAQETEAQIKARQALEQKMKELQTSGSTGTPAAPATAAKPLPKPAAEPAPTPSAAATQDTQTPKIPAAQPPTSASAATIPGMIAPPPSNPDAIERAREAMRQKLRETPAPSEVPPAAPPVASRPLPPPSTQVPAPRPLPPPTAAVPPQTPAPAMSAPVQKPVTPAPVATRKTRTTASSDSQNAKFAPLPAESNPEAAQKAQQALREQREAEINTAVNQANTRQWAPTPKPGGKPAPPTTRVRNTAPLPELAGPPTGLPPAKEQRLWELLEQYKADRITPDQYQAERAKILAAP